MVCTGEALFSQDQDHSVVKGGMEFPSGDSGLGRAPKILP